MVPCFQFTIRSKPNLSTSLTFTQTGQLMWNHVLHSWYHFVALPRLQGSSSCELNSWGDPVQPWATATFSHPKQQPYLLYSKSLRKQGKQKSPLGSRINQDPLEPLELWQCCPCLAPEVSLGPWFWHGAGARCFWGASRIRVQRVGGFNFSCFQQFNCLLKGGGAFFIFAFAGKQPFHLLNVGLMW